MNFTPSYQLDDAALSKRRAFFRKFQKVSDKITNPLSFFGMLAVASLATLVFPALPNLLLLTLGGAALTAISSKFIGDRGTAHIDAIRENRNRVSQPATTQAEIPVTVAPTPTVSQLPDLTEAFGKGLDTAVKVRTLRLKNSSGSAFISN